MHKRENGGLLARQGRGIGNGRRFPGRRRCCPVRLAMVEYTHEMAFLWNEIAGTCSDSGQDTRNRRLCDIDFAETVTPALSTVRIDGTRMGQTAAGWIADRAEGKAVAQPVVDIGFSIVERGSS